MHFIYRFNQHVSMYVKWHFICSSIVVQWTWVSDFLRVQTQRSKWLMLCCCVSLHRRGWLMLYWLPCMHTCDVALAIFSHHFVHKFALKVMGACERIAAYRLFPFQLNQESKCVWHKLLHTQLLAFVSLFWEGVGRFDFFPESCNLKKNFFLLYIYKKKNCVCPLAISFPSDFCLDAHFF